MKQQNFVLLVACVLILSVPIAAIVLDNKSEASESQPYTEDGHDRSADLPPSEEVLRIELPEPPAFSEPRSEPLGPEFTPRPLHTPPPTPEPTVKTNPVAFHQEPLDEDALAAITLVPDSKILYVSATAYTTERQTNKITATGTTARLGAIAVDPTVIPYGSRMFVMAADGSWVYGYATAEDCGGGIKGNKIDLFFDTYDECIWFGVKKAVVYILD